MRPARPVIALALLGLALPLTARAGSAPDPTQAPVAQLYAIPFTDDTARPVVPPLTGLDGGFHEYVGSMHEHSGYSDGWAGSTPATYYASGKHFGLDFMGGSDHSDLMGAPVSTSQYCAPSPAGSEDPTDPVTIVTNEPHCIGGDDSDETKSLDKWDATKAYARAASTTTYAAFQGFEWTSDVYGHINVYFSKNYENAKMTTPTPELLYSWLGRRPELGGGSDGVFVFNHPGAKDQTKPVRQNSQELIADSTFLNWKDFAYDPAMDRQAVGMEVYNDVDEYGSTRDTDKYPEGYFAHVLDKGWHVAPIGAEDLATGAATTGAARRGPRPSCSRPTTPAPPSRPRCSPAASTRSGTATSASASTSTARSWARG